MWNLRQELPPQRRDASARHRRIRKVGRIVRKRLIIALLLFAALSSFFGWKALRDRGSGNKSRSNIGFSAVPSIIHAGLHFRNHDNDSGVWVYPGTSRIKESRQYGPDVAKHLYTGYRRRHGPCDIDFVKSVDHFIEPDVYMNFTRFSLGYIDEEKKYDGESSFYGRFAGHQTLAERENSFYVRSQTIHCGFVRQSRKSAGIGFDLDDKAYEYMNACKVVVSSCIFGGFDFLRRPTRSKISEYSKKNVCFVMFLDQISMTKLYSDGQIPDNSGYIGLWRIVEVRNLPYMDMRKSGKVPKFLSHRLFPSARYSIWIDSKLRLNADPMLILEYFLWRKKSEYAISNHYDRHCVWEEVLQNKRLNKYNHSAIDKQFNFYQSDGLTKFNESGMSDLPSYVPEGSFIIRAHTPMSNLFSCLWFNEVDLFTSRDQLSFAYTFLKLRRMNPERPFFFNMFKDCERRALAKLFRHRNEYPHPPPDV